MNFKFNIKKLHWYKTIKIITLCTVDITIFILKHGILQADRVKRSRKCCHETRIQQIQAVGKAHHYCGVQNQLLLQNFRK